MSTDDIVAGTLVPVDASVPSAAALWQDQPDLFDRLRRRLASYAPNTQRALAADWRRWRAWCAEFARQPFPAQPSELVEYLLAHSPALEQDASGTVSLAVDVNGGNVKRASTVSRWLASLSNLHRIAEVADPTRDEDVKAARRTLARGRWARSDGMRKTHQQESRRSAPRRTRPRNRRT